MRAEFIACAEKQAGAGLAARAAVGGRVRAEKMRGEFHARAREVGAQERMERVVVGLGEEPAPKPALVRDDGEPKASGCERAQAVGDAGQQRVVGFAVWVAGVAHERAVAGREK